MLLLSNSRTETDVAVVVVLILLVVTTTMENRIRTSMVSTTTRVFYGVLQFKKKKKVRVIIFKISYEPNIVKIKAFTVDKSRDNA